MVWFDNRSSVSSSSRRRSPRRSGSVYSTNYSRHSAPSLFPSAASANGYGGGSGSRRSKSPSIFSTSSSSRRAKPRAGFVQRVVRYVKKLLHDIHRYARHHPIKTFLVVIVPLFVSGVLQKLLGMIGVPLPRRSLGKLAGPGPGESLTDHIWSLFKVVKMIV